MSDRNPAYRTDVNRSMGLVSTGASIIAGFFMVCGFLLLVLQRGALPSNVWDLRSPPLMLLVPHLRRLSPVAFMGFGLFMLAMIPMLRIIVVLIFFWQSRNFRYVLASTGVLLVLVLSILLA